MPSVGAIPAGSAKERRAAAKSNGASVSFESFCELCAGLEAKTGHNEKTAMIKAAIPKFNNPWLLFTFLLPKQEKRVYNLKDKSIAKLLSPMLGVSETDFLEHSEKFGDISLTGEHYMQASGKEGKTSNNGRLTMGKVDDLLEKLTTSGTDSTSEGVFRDFFNSDCTALELKYFIRILKGDVRISLGAANVLPALGPNAYPSFKTKADLLSVIEKFGPGGSHDSASSLVNNRAPSSGVTPGTPCSPMLADAAKDIKKVLRKSPEGLFCEIKYDGERVQVHKEASGKMSFFSRFMPLPTCTRTLALIQTHNSLTSIPILHLLENNPNFE